MSVQFQVGQKVVCVDDRRIVLLRPPGLWRFVFRAIRLDHNLNRGDVYTVTFVTAIEDITGKAWCMLNVAEAWFFEKRDFPFPSIMFRPVIEKKTSIAAFEKLLTPATRKLEEV
jgi:hypothetical protein